MRLLLKRDNRLGIAALFVISLILFSSGSAYSTIFSNVVPIFFVLLLLASILVYVCKNKNKRKHDKWKFTILCLMEGAALASLLINKDGISNYYRFMIAVLSAYLLTSSVSFESMVFIYHKVFTFLTVIAIITFPLSFTNLCHRLPELVNINGAIYKNGFLFMFIEKYGTISHRAMSIFWEPGLFGSFLLIGLILDYLTDKKININRTILYIIGIIITNSAAGVILLIPYACLFISKTSYKQSIKIMIWFCLSVLFFGLIIFSNNLTIWLINSGNERLLRLFSINDVSTATRIYSPYINFLIFLRSPLFGKGFYGANQLYLNAIAGTSIGAQTSTSFFIMASLGIIGIMYTVAILHGCIIQKHLILIERICILTILLGIVNKEPHTVNVLTWILIYYMQLNSHYRDRTSYA